MQIIYNSCFSNSNQRCFFFPDGNISNICLSNFPRQIASHSVKLPFLLLSSEKVHKEIKEVLGTSQSICYQDRKKVPYTNAVIHEIIRSKYILLFGLPRECVKDVYMGNFLIPKVKNLTYWISGGLHVHVGNFFLIS